MSGDKLITPYDANMTNLAEFVDEALQGLGIADSPGEILDSYYGDGGYSNVKTAQKHYNNAIIFRNEILGHLEEHGGVWDLITDEDLEDWGFEDEDERCIKCGQPV